jgi:hypothetical protein
MTATQYRTLLLVALLGVLPMVCWLDSLWGAVGLFSVSWLHQVALVTELHEMGRALRRYRRRLVAERGTSW